MRHTAPAAAILAAALALLGCSDDATRRPAADRTSTPTETTGTTAPPTSASARLTIADLGAPEAECEPYEPTAPRDVDGPVLVTLGEGSVAVDTGRPARAHDVLLFIESVAPTPLELVVVAQPPTGREPRLDDGSLDLAAIQPGAGQARVSAIEPGARCALRLTSEQDNYVIVVEGFEGVANLWAVFTAA